MNSPLTYVGKRTRQGYVWDKPLTTVQWVEKSVRLNADTSPITGMLNLKYSPHLIEMFNDYDVLGKWKFIGKYSTQCGKTLFLQCCMAKKLDTKPTKLQWAIPNESAVNDYILDKIDPFLRGVKTLNDKVEDYKSKEKSRIKRTRVKVAGGDAIFTGTSASSKRSKTVKELYCDEADLFEDGSLIELEGRTKSYEAYGRKVIATSSQSRENGEIAKAYDSCITHKEWSTTCDKCGHVYLAGSTHLKWITKKEYAELKEIKEEDIVQTDYKAFALEDVRVECPDCDHPLTTQEKNQNILTGKYKFVIVRGTQDGKTIGYSGNALSMFFTSFETIANLIIDAEASGTLDDMKQIYLDYFNEIYKDETVQTDKNDILLLSNGLDTDVIPNGTVKLYLTIDTQKDGFWYKITAFQYGFRANTVKFGYVKTFDELEILMGMKFYDEKGGLYVVDMTLIDRMGIRERTIEVDAWIEYLLVELGMEGKVYPTMGIQNDASGRSWYETTVNKDLTTLERRKTPLPAIKINNTSVKNELAVMIERSVKKAQGDEDYQTTENRLFFINQDIVRDAEARDQSISKDYERQMTSESYVYAIHPKTGNQAVVKSWENLRQTDNHLWDNSVQAVVCALMDNVALMQKPVEDTQEFDKALDDLF